MYELRSWFDDSACLYTDDVRVKDLAIQSPDLRIASTYFRSMREHQAFAWDIVGQRDVLATLAGRFGRAPLTLSRSRS